MGFDPSTAALIPEATPPVSRRFDPTTAQFDPSTATLEADAPPAARPRRFDNTPDMSEDEINAVQAGRLKEFGPDAPDEALPRKPQPTAPYLYPGETTGEVAPVTSEPGSGLTAVPKSKLAPVFSAAKRGWEETPNIVGPEAEAWIKQHGGGDGLIGALNSPSLLLGAGMAGFRGVQELVNQELIPVVGEQGARDIAAMPEAFPTGLGHQPTALHDVATGRIRPPTPGDMGAYEAGFARDRGLGIEARTPEEVAGYDIRKEREAANSAREPPKQLTGPAPLRPQTPEQAAMDEAAIPEPTAPTVAPNAPAGTEPVPGEAPLADLARISPALTAPEAPPAPRAPNPKLPEPGGAAIALGGPDVPSPEVPSPVSPVSPEVSPDTTPATSGATPPFDPTTATPEAPVSGSYVMLDPRQLAVDPKRFQFKESNERGVTGALEGTNRWESDLASPIMAWQANDGQLFVADGHQRHDLATRAQAAGQDNVQIPAKVYREADGYTPEYMRALAAYKNISEGSGTAIDAAKVMRGVNAIPTNRALPALPPKQQMVQQGAALAKLSDEAFGVVVNGIVPPGYAAHVGAMIADPAEQMGALTVLARAQPANSEQARMMVKDIINSGFAKQAADDQGRFPWEDDNAVMPLFSERARVLDNAMRNLRGTRRVFKAAVEGEDALTGAGNVLDTEGNVRAKTENERLLDTLERNATTHGPVSDALNSAARDLAGGRPVAGVVSQFLAKTRALVRSGQDTSLRPGDTAGGAGETGAGETEQPVEGQEGFFAGKRLPPPPKSGPDLFGGERAQAARRTSEPTIKDDQRQITMPGMEPSAVQAQAARDQVGPRSNQQPVNEGLFARPETPQPELPTPEAARPVSRWAGNNGPEFVDELHLIPDLNGGHAVAGNWVFERGRETGHEHLAVVENATGRIIHAGTVRQKSFVTFKTENMLDARDAYTVHHNHPNSSSLSGGDITMLAAPGLSHVVAHAENGDTFHAALNFTGADPRTSVIPEVAAHQRRLQQTAAVQRGRMENILVDMVKRGEITYPEANAALGDMINRILHADGVIHYVSTRELPKIIADRLKTVLRGRGHAPGTIDRSAIAVRPEERVAGLPRPDGSEPLQGPPGGEAGGGTGPPRSGATGQGQLLEELSAMPPLPLRGGHLNVDILSDKTGLPRLMAEAKVAFSPTSLRGAQPMELAMRKHGAEAAVAFQRAAVSLRSVRDAVDRLSRADQIDFTHRMETGQRQSSPALQTVAGMLRTTIDDWAKTIQGMGRGYLQNAITDYMGHIWGNYREWAAGQVPAGQTGGSPTPGGAHAAAQGKRPLQGSGAFLKQRTFPTQLDGINAGLVPATYNPVDLQLLKIREMQKFYFGAKLADYMKHTGMATWVPEADFHAAQSSGFVKLDDRIFQPQIRGAHAAGPVTPGAYYAIEPQARLFNRYMSQGIAGKSAWYDMFRAAGNALNSIQLAWPGFHTAFVTMDTANSRFALGLQQAAHGQIVNAAGSLALGVGPGAVVKSLVTGTRLRKALLDPAAASPEYRQLADDFIMGGGRLSMDQFYQSAAAGSFIHGWKGFDPRRIAQQIAQMYRDAPPGWRKQVSLPVQVAFRSLDTMMHPLMGWLVPRAKVGVFGEMMRAWHDANPNATLEDRAAASTRAWDNTEDRLGQYTYDNVFWDKTLKDVAFIGFRSVGWNLGTLRAGAGAVADTGKFIADAARLRRPEFTGRMAYGIAQFVNQALLGATITYLLTGSGPQSWLDYFFPRTGGTTPQGEPERLTPPGYVKDWIEWARAPAQTLANKVHPLISLGLQMKNNRDYYGGIIDASGIDPDVNMAAAYGDFLINSVMPFTVRGYGRLEAEGASQAAKTMSLFGFNPAPKSIVSPERGEAFQLKDDIKAYRRQMREPGRSHVFTPNPP